MKNAQKTFRRYENKYLITREQYTKIKNRISEYTVPDDYGSYTVCNLYFDTDSFEIIRRSIEKP